MEKTENVMTILKYYDKYLDESHNSKHITAVMDHASEWYAKMAESDSWFNSNVTAVMCKIAALFHDIGMCEPIYDFISELHKSMIESKPDWDKKTIVRKNHHWVSAEFFWYLVSHETTNCELPFNIKGFDSEWLRRQLTEEEAKLIKQAILHHRASTVNEYAMNAFDRYIRSCDGFNTAEGNLYRSIHYNYARTEDKEDFTAMAYAVRTHLTEKYLARNAYSEHLPCKFIDDLRQKEVSRLRTYLEVDYPTDDKLGTYLKSLM
jgi:hypothetical protein